MLAISAFVVAQNTNSHNVEVESFFMLLFRLPKDFLYSAIVKMVCLPQNAREKKKGYEKEPNRIPR